MLPLNITDLTTYSKIIDFNNYLLSTIKIEIKKVVTVTVI